MIKTNTQKGQVIIINTLLFFALSTAIIFAITSPVISSFHITKSFSKSKEAFLLANSAASEALYKLNTGKTLSSAETLTLSQGEAIITVADTMDGKTVSIDSNVDSYQRNYQLNVSTGAGISFNYGLQVGQGGFDLNGGSSGIVGNVYSNGDIVGSGGAYITGSAVAASISSPTITVSNTGIVNPLYQIDFGGSSNATPQDTAQSFTVGTTTEVVSVRVLIKKTNSPSSNITMRIVQNNSGTPSKTELASATIIASTVTSTFNYITIPLSSAISLTPGTTYWLVFDTADFGGPYYSLGANNNVFAGGESQTSIEGWKSSKNVTWNATSPSTLDVYFDIYVGGNTGIIDGISVGSDGVGDAWSHEVKNSSVAGNLYCQVGSSNGGKECDTSRTDPVQQSWPISEGNIVDWKAEAALGGATSSVSISSGSQAIGPIQINGDLNVTSGSTLNLNGTVYVTGNINVSSNGTVKVNPALSSKGVVLITDGRINSNGGGKFEGSGVAGSYILLVTTSTCPSGAGCSGNNAVDIDGGAGAVIINAQNGTIGFGGGAQAKQATANKIVLSGNATITYDTGLVNPNFTSGPSGAWNVSSWKEVE